MVVVSGRRWGERDREERGERLQIREPIFIQMLVFSVSHPEDIFSRNISSDNLPYPFWRYVMIFKNNEKGILSRFVVRGGKCEGDLGEGEFWRFRRRDCKSRVCAAVQLCPTPVSVSPVT